MIRQKLAAIFLFIVLFSCTAVVQTVLATAPTPADPMTVLKTGIDQVMAVFN
ncbi:MAG: hypothetical protein JOZ29_19585, partial [Deltaproteobacteria bacterium]|nr:hypothetical protein [Deltaproteobacteria bacterium]